MQLSLSFGSEVRSSFALDAIRLVQLNVNTSNISLHGNGFEHDLAILQSVNARCCQICFCCTAECGCQVLSQLQCVESGVCIHTK
jgi:hypothetical protein